MFTRDTRELSFGITARKPSEIDLGAAIIAGLVDGDDGPTVGISRYGTGTGNDDGEAYIDLAITVPDSCSFADIRDLIRSIARRNGFYDIDVDHD